MAKPVFTQGRSQRYVISVYYYYTTMLSKENNIFQMYLHGFVHVDTAKVAVLKTFVHVWDGSNCECLQP